MKQYRLMTVVVLLLLSLLAQPVAAQPLPIAPHDEPTPQEPVDDAAVSLEPSAAAIAGLANLKAVVVVGPIDGDTGTQTVKEVTNSKLIAAKLRGYGIQVAEFYPPNTPWTDIVAAAQGAHFLFYRGHGVASYGNSASPDWVGGFYLGSYGAITDVEIRRDLKMAPNGLVFIYSCFAYGTSGDENEVVSSAEAQRRVALYAQPFLETGVAGFYANGSVNAFLSYIDSLASGKTQREAYEGYSNIYYGYNKDTVERYAFPKSPYTAFGLWLGKYYANTVAKYSNSFVGQADKRLTDLYQPILSVAPLTLTALAEVGGGPAALSVAVRNSGLGSFNWTAQVVQPQNNSQQAAASAFHLELPTIVGQSSQDLTILAHPGSQVGTFSGAIQVTADSNVGNRVQTVNIQLIVVQSLATVYLPAITR